MNCPNCNAENMEGAKFCLKCGAPLTGDVETQEIKINAESPTAEEIKHVEVKPLENSEPQEFNPLKAAVPEKTNEPQEIKPTINPTPGNSLEPQEFKPVIQKEEKIKEPKEPKEHKKMGKGLKTTLIAVAVIIVLVGGFRLIFPREFFQLILSDSKYNQYLLAQEFKGAKNSVVDVAEDRLTTKESRSYETSMNVELGKSTAQLLPADSSAFATSLVNYLNTVKIKGEATVNGTDSKQNIQITDNNGALLTLNTIQDNSIEYLNVNELSKKWFKLSPQGYQLSDYKSLINEYEKMNKEEKQLKSSSTELAKTLLSVYDVAKIDITSNQTFTIGAESVTGDKSSVTITAAQLLSTLDKTEIQAKNDTQLYNTLKAYYNKTIATNAVVAKMVSDTDFKFSKDVYNEYIGDIFSGLKNEINSNRLKTLTIDQYINRKNEIIGIQLKFDCANKDNDLVISYINNKKESAPQIAFKVAPTNQAKDYVLFQLKGEDEKNGTASAETRIDGESGKVNLVYKDLQKKDGFLIGQMDITYSGAESEGSSVFKNSKITYKSTLDDKTDKVTFKLDAGDYGKIVLNSTAKIGKAEDIKPVSNAIELMNSNNELTSKASAELQSGLMSFYTGTLGKHQDLAVLIQEGITMYSSSLLGRNSDFSAAADENSGDNSAADYSGLLGAG